MFKTRGLTSIPRTKVMAKTNPMVAWVLSVISVKAMDTSKHNVPPF